MATETKKGRKKEDNNFLTSVRTYFGEVRTELNKVSWPTRDDVRRLTIIVLAVTVVSSLALGILSFILSIVMNDYGMQYPLILAVLFALIVAGTVWSFSRESSSKGGY
jgi:preprotein translocase subunit SecE